MTVLELITAAYRKIGVAQSGETLPASHAEDALTELNRMLQTWQTRGLVVLHEAWQTFTLSSGVASYVIGSGATFDSTRPNQVTGGYITSDGGDYPLSVLSAFEYRAIYDKALGGIPTSFHYRPSTTSGVLYFYPVPDDTYSINLSLLRPLALVALADEITFPSYYDDVLISHLAIRMCPEFDREPSKILLLFAGDAMETLMANQANLNLSEARIDPMLLAIGQRSW